MPLDRPFPSAPLGVYGTIVAGQTRSMVDFSEVSLKVTHVLAATHRPSPRVMAAGRGQGVPREMLSVVLDRLFLELHDQLPKEF